MCNNCVIQQYNVGFCIFVVFIVYFVMASSVTAKLSDDQISALVEVTNGANSCTFDIFRILSRENPNSNVFTSPISLQLVMALAYSGAGGKTAEEIATALKIPKEMGKMFEGYNALINVLKSPVLSVASKMFLEKTFHVKEEFSKNAVQYFESEPDQVNFRSNSNGAKNTINHWVEKKTNNKIRDLIPDGALNANTLMVLVNAIHFKADWKNPFSEKNTHPEKFYLNEKDTVEVQMMHKTDDFGYSENSALDCKILQIKYEGDQFSMYILLPNKITGLPALEEAISKMDLCDVIKDTWSAKVIVSLPKFEITQLIDFNDVLKSLGVKTMFDGNEADFSGISDEPLVVSKVFQKAFIQVDEKGTEAAAATGLMISNRAFSVRETFKANHPFLFLISRRLKSMDEFIIFIGKFSSQNNKSMLHV